MLNREGSVISGIIGRNQVSTLSDRQYNAVIGGVLTWGFVITAIICRFSGGYFAEFLSQGFLSLIIFIAAYFVLTIVGSAISAKSGSAAVSFIGYNIVVIATGILLSTIVYTYASVDIVKAVAVTGLVSIIMTVLGTLYPRAFLRMGRTLFICLIVVIVLELLMILFHWYSSNLELIINGAVVLIFSLYIAHDWSRAQLAPKTADNAVDICVSLYMDIINLFIRLLDILDSFN